MGLAASGWLSWDEIEETEETSPFNHDEIAILYERFTYLDRSNRGILTFAELKMLPEFDSNPLGMLILKYIEEHYEVMNFACFVDFLSIFSKKTDQSRRIAYFFDLLDLDKTGRLTWDVLARVNEMMGGKDKREVDRTIKKYDKTVKGYLDYKDIERMYKEEGIDKRVIIEFGRNRRQMWKMRVIDMILPGFIRRIWKK